MSAETSSSAPADEAGESPRWLPLMGLVIFVVGVAWVALGQLSSDEEAAPELEIEAAALAE